MGHEGTTRLSFYCPLMQADVGEMCLEAAHDADRADMFISRLTASLLSAQDL